MRLESSRVEAELYTEGFECPSTRQRLLSLLGRVAWIVGHVGGREAVVWPQRRSQLEGSPPAARPCRPRSPSCDPWLESHSTRPHHLLTRAAMVDVSKQPAKAVYITYHVVSSLLVRFPLWTAIGLVPALRPRRSWTLGRAFRTRLIEYLIYLSGRCVHIFFAPLIPNSAADYTYPKTRSIRASPGA
jgi:hypothetical protein